MSIRGRVADARSGAPLRRARVTITVAGRAGDPVFTGDDGRFIVRDAPRPPLTVTVSKAGFTSSVLMPSAAQLTGTLSFALSQSAAIMGRVLDRSGVAVSPTGAYVTARLISGGDAGSAIRNRFHTETDALGDYRLGALPAGRYEVTAIRIPPLQRMNGDGPLEDRLFGSRDSFDVARVVTVSVAPGDEVRDIDFTVPSVTRTCASGPPVAPSAPKGTGRIQGHVVGPTGEPLACAQVYISLDVATYIPTDANGLYSFTGLPAGSFVVQAFMPGYLHLHHGQRHPSDEAAVVTLGEGQSRDRVDISLPREAIVSGR